MQYWPVIIPLVGLVVGCATDATRQGRLEPTQAQPFVWRTDFDSEKTRVLPQDVAKAILVARACLENEPQFDKGRGPYTFEVYRHGQGWSVVVWSNTSTAKTIEMSSDWAVVRVSAS